MFFKTFFSILRTNSIFFRCSNYSQKYCMDIIQLFIFRILKKTHKFVKISKTSGNTVVKLTVNCLHSRISVKYF
eukprot:UN24216